MKTFTDTPKSTLLDKLCKLKFDLQWFSITKMYNFEDKLNFYFTFYNKENDASIQVNFPSDSDYNKFENNQVTLMSIIDILADKKLDWYNIHGRIKNSGYFKIINYEKPIEIKKNLIKRIFNL